VTWIKVSDKGLPFDKPILVYAKTKWQFEGDRGYMATVAVMKASSGSIWLAAVGFSGYEWEYDFEYKDITHWAELPEAPQ